MGNDSCPLCGGPLTGSNEDAAAMIGAVAGGPFGCDACQWVEGTPMWSAPDEAGRAHYAAWLAERPEHVRVVAARFNPWQVYRLKSTGQACQFQGCDEGAQNCGEPEPPPDRVTLFVAAQHPALGEISRVGVFGVDPDGVEPWPPGTPFEPDQPMTVRVSTPPPPPRPVTYTLGSVVDSPELADMLAASVASELGKQVHPLSLTRLLPPSRSEFSQLPAADPGRNHVSRQAPDYVKDLVLVTEPPEESAARRRIIEGVLERLRTMPRLDLIASGIHHDKAAIAMHRANHPERVGHVGMVTRTSDGGFDLWGDLEVHGITDVYEVQISDRRVELARERRLRRDLKRTARRRARRRARILLSIRRHPERWPAVLVQLAGLKVNEVQVQVTGIDPGKGRDRTVVVAYRAQLPPAASMVVLDSMVGLPDVATGPELDMWAMTAGIPGRRPGGR